MKTFVFNEKNGNAALILSAENEREAFQMLKEKVKDFEGWRLEEVDDE